MWDKSHNEIKSQNYDMLSQLWEKSQNWDKKSIMRYCVSEIMRRKAEIISQLWQKNIMAKKFKNW